MRYHHQDIILSCCGQGETSYPASHSTSWASIQCDHCYLTRFEQRLEGGMIYVIVQSLINNIILE